MWCPKLLNNTDHGVKSKKHQAPLKNNWTPLAFSYIKLFGQKSHFFKGERSFEIFRVFKGSPVLGDPKVSQQGLQSSHQQESWLPNFPFFESKFMLASHFEAKDTPISESTKKTLGIQTHDHEQLNQCSFLLSNEPMLGAFFQNENPKKNSGAKGRGSGVLKLG